MKAKLVFFCSGVMVDICKQEGTIERMKNMLKIEVNTGAAGQSKISAPVQACHLVQLPSYSSRLKALLKSCSEWQWAVLPNLCGHGSWRSWYIVYRCIGVQVICQGEVIVCWGMCLASLINDGPKSMMIAKLLFGCPHDKKRHISWDEPFIVNSGTSFQSHMDCFSNPQFLILKDLNSHRGNNISQIGFETHCCILKLVHITKVVPEHISVYITQWICSMTSDPTNQHPIALVNWISCMSLCLYCSVISTMISFNKIQEKNGLNIVLPLLDQLRLLILF